MSVEQLIQKYQALPLELQEEVSAFIDSIFRRVQKQSSSSNTTDLEAVLTRAESPNHLALSGLNKEKPISLKEIRRKAWR